MTQENEELRLKIAVMENRLETQGKELERVTRSDQSLREYVQGELKEMRAKQSARDRNLLVGMISTIGAMLLALMGAIWQNRDAFFK